MHSLGALAGLRVVDQSDRLGAYCTKLLVDLGGDVIKLEPPEGDELRRSPPFKGGRSHPEASLAFAYYHRSKRGLTLACGRPESRPIRVKLLAWADVVVTSSFDLPGIDEREEFVSRGGIVCAITPFGLTGPYRDASATHLTSTAMGGAMVSAGDGTPPRPIPDQQLYDEAGVHAALGILAALRNVPAVGGQFVEIAVHEVVAAKGYGIHRFALAGFDELQTAGAVFPPPVRTYQCRDGAIEFQVIEAHQWRAFRELLGDPEELGRDEYDERDARGRDAERINAVIQRVLADQPKAEVFRRAQELGVPCSPLNTLLEFALDPQTAARGTFSRSEVRPHLGEYPVMRTARASQPLWVQGRPAPMLGEHNDVVYADLGFGRDEIAAWRHDGLI